MSQTIFITGATGTIGRRLCNHLSELGFSIVALTRNPERARAKFANTAIAFVAGEITNTDDQSWWPAVASADHVINLVGEPVVQRWTTAAWDKIKESRVTATNQLVKAIAASQNQVKTLVSTSAIGIYGSHYSYSFNESSPAGQDRLAQLCISWENAAREASDTGCRVVIIRVGVVLDHDGGMLARVLPIFRAGLGGKLGNGSQWMSWIHIDDLVRIYANAVTEPAYKGNINATSPIPVTNLSFTAALGEVLQKPTFCRVPKLAIRAILGEAGNIVLEGQKVIPQRLSEQGFEFTHPTLQSALHQLLKR